MESYNHKSRLQAIHNHLNDIGDYLKKIHKNAKETERCFKGADNLLKKRFEERNCVNLHHGGNTFLLSSQALYKKGYDFMLFGNYVDAEKVFCAFQQRYKKDPLSNDVLFWLAEVLLR
ncbi:hypothetical protein [Bartonella koehlerae]|uniref:Uncharacterized protein n=1 Tax=Bartonella koehlerae C-29 TaxID=1134510 RepID=A0A067W9V0_9HYPH|nr:hypothetical protein [Bartonella koehlerae]KEC56589.1 hypothetical protein O9A_00083 [Bartonella koehlerae C-29]